MELATHVQIFDEASRISLHTNDHEKGMNPYIIHPAMVGQTVFFNLGWATTLEESKLKSNQLYSA